MKRDCFAGADFHPVMFTPQQIPELNFTGGFDLSQLKDETWGIGGYAERRPGMYTAPQYEGKRFIHMGIDIWAPAGQPVFSPYKGQIAYKANHQQQGNYGPAIILHHQINGVDLFALYGHLSEKSLDRVEIHQPIQKGEEIGTLGKKDENGGWYPHLHYQLSWKNPGEPDMPGVVSEDELEPALQTYPDPRIILGPVY